MLFGRKNKDKSGAPGQAPGDVGYIKQHTLGSSNEISFSVLDSKINSTGETASTQKAAPTKALSSSPDTVTQPRWTFSSSEVNARKAQRKRSRLAVIIIAILLACIALSVTGFFAMRAIQHQMNYIEQLDDQTAALNKQLEKLDPYFELVNNAINMPLSSIDAEQQAQLNNDLSQQIPNAKSNLENIKHEVERLQQYLLTPSDTEKSNDTLSSINATLNLLELGGPIMEWACKSSSDYALATIYLSDIVESDGLAREAANLANRSTEDTMRASMDRSKECVDILNVARNAITDLRDGSVDAMKEILQPYVNYVSLRIEAQEAAIQADQAYLSVNSAQLISASSTYDQKETEAAELFATFGGVYPPEIIEQAYSSARDSNHDVEQWRLEYSRIFRS